MVDCIFCKIAKKEAPGKFEYESERLFAFHNKVPRAPLHVLIIPKEHIMESMNDFTLDHTDLLAEMFELAKGIATKYGADKYGYKLLFNVGEGGGQSIMHLHLHVIGKKKSGDKIELTKT